MDKGYLKELARQENTLFSATQSKLKTHSPEPSLLHGDLWGGNKGFTHTDPVIFDPASYYGDRETDIAFTHMFGDFTADFYTGYNSRWPLPADHVQRTVLYNLYHQLNHLNLFGPSYASGCKSMIEHIINDSKN